MGILIPLELLQTSHPFNPNKGGVAQQYDSGIVAVL